MSCLSARRSEVHSAARFALLLNSSGRAEKRRCTTAPLHARAPDTRKGVSLAVTCSHVVIKTVTPGCVFLLSAIFSVKSAPVSFIDVFDAVTVRGVNVHDHTHFCGFFPT